MSDQLSSSCEVSKAKRTSFKSKSVPSLKGRLNLLHMDLCGPMRVASINGKKYILKKELSIKLLLLEHLNRTTLSKDETALSLRLLERCYRLLNFLYSFAEAIATACYTQNRSIIILTHEKIAYHIINDRKPSIKHLHIFGCTCYLTRDGENLDKMKEKGDPCILVGYSTQSKGYRVYNKRTRLIVESIISDLMRSKRSPSLHVANDTSGLDPQRQKASDYDNPDPRTRTTKCFSFSRYNSSITTRVHEHAVSSTRNIVIQMCIPQSNLRRFRIPDDKRSPVNFKFMEIHPSQCKQDNNLQHIPEMCYVRTLRFCRIAAPIFSNLSDGHENAFLNGPLKERIYACTTRRIRLILSSNKVYR
ncbi:uncharacterized mitochondrial protein-like protein [Tanacetum coccineum]